MTALIAPNGARVNVSTEKAARLKGQGYQPVRSASKKAAKSESDDNE